MMFRTLLALMMICAVLGVMIGMAIVERMTS